MVLLLVFLCLSLGPPLHCCQCFDPPIFRISIFIADWSSILVYQTQWSQFKFKLNFEIKKMQLTNSRATSVFDLNCKRQGYWGRSFNLLFFSFNIDDQKLKCFHSVLLRYPKHAYFLFRPQTRKLIEQQVEYPDAGSKDGYAGLLTWGLLDLASWATKDGMTWNLHCNGHNNRQQSNQIHRQ